MDARRRQRSWADGVRGLDDIYREGFWRTLSDCFSLEKNDETRINNQNMR